MSEYVENLKAATLVSPSDYEWWYGEKHPNDVVHSLCSAPVSIKATHPGEQKYADCLEVALNDSLRYGLAVVKMYSDVEPEGNPLLLLLA